MPSHTDVDVIVQVVEDLPDFDRRFGVALPILILEDLGKTNLLGNWCVPLGLGIRQWYRDDPVRAFIEESLQASEQVRPINLARALGDEVDDRVCEKRLVAKAVVESLL